MSRATLYPDEMPGVSGADPGFSWGVEQVQHISAVKKNARWGGGGGGGAGFPHRVFK